MSHWMPFTDVSDLHPGLRLRRFEEDAENPWYYATVVDFPDLDSQSVAIKYDRFHANCKLHYCICDFEIMENRYQKIIDCLHKVYSRLHSYATQRISNRYKQPDKYLLREKARELRSFLERMNRSFVCWRDSDNPVIDYALPEYISDINSLLIRFDRDCNLRQFSSDIKEAIQALFDQMIKLIPAGQSVQLEMFDSGFDFSEDFAMSKSFGCIFVDFSIIPALKSVAEFLKCVACSSKYPPSLLSKSLWKSAFSFRQLSFADI